VPLLLVGVFLMPSAATAGKEEAAGYYEAAVMRLEKGEAEAAIIELKNALQQDPDLLAARVLLGKAHVEQGDGAAAEKELVLADRLGADRSLTAAPMAKAYLQQYKYQELLEHIHAEAFPPPLRAELLVYRGHAHVELRQFDKAEQAFNEAGRLEPESALPIAGQALALLRRGELDAARRQIDKALGRAPGNADVRNIKASIDHARGDLQGAIVGYDKVVALKPKHLDARIARAAALMDLGRDAEAGSALERLREEFPYEPRAGYLQSVLLARNNEPQKAKAALEETAAAIEQLTPDILEKRPQLLLLAGLANYSLNQHEKARGFLGRYIEQFPGQPGPRKLLGSIHLAEGNYDKVLEVLEPALQVAPNDYRLLSLLAAAQMRKGRHEQATALLEKAVALSAGAPELRTGLALSHLGAGQQALALEELASVFERDSDQTTAGIALGALYLKRGEIENAERVAQALSEREPENVTVLNLLGMVQVAAKKHTEARASFERALVQNPGFLTARINLAKLDVVEGEAEAAITRLKAILEKDANNIRVMIELAKVEQAQGNPDETARWLEKAREIDRNALAVRLYLAEHYLRTGKAKAAADVAQEAEIIAPENLEVLAVSGRAQLALGKVAIAKVIFRRMSGLAQDDYQWLYRIAGYQLAANAIDNGIWSLQKAVNENRKFLPARVALVEAQLRAGRMEKARENAQGVRSDYPKRGVGYRLVGDVYAQHGDYTKAIEHWRRAQQQLQSDPKSVQELGALIASVEEKQSGDTTATQATSSKAARPAKISVRVMLDPALQQHARPEDVVFIYAKAAQGPPMPLAAVRKKVKDLPVEVVLDDTTAMMPAMKLSSFKPVVVMARISKTGTATLAKGDMTGQTGPLDWSEVSSAKVSIGTLVQ